MRNLLMRTNARLARVPGAAGLALKIRNQCNLVIGNALTDGREPRQWLNGEFDLIRCAAPTCRSFVDVGANVGVWTQFLLDSASAEISGILIEPSQSAAKRLRDRFSAYAELEIVEAVAGDESSPEITFFEEENAGQNASVLANPRRARPAVARPVAVVTVAALVERRGWAHVDILKIDTEGYDLHVLRGASPLLFERRVGAVQIEYSPEWSRARSTLAEALNLFERCGYRVYVLTGQGLHPFEYEPWSEYFASTNFVALPPESMHTFESMLAR